AGEWLILANARQFDVDDFADAVALSVLPGRANGDRLNIDAIDGTCAEECRPGGQDAGTNADIDHPPTRLQLVLDGDHRELGGGVEARAEGHAGIELDDDFSWRGGVAVPGSAYEDVAADAVDAVVRLPGVGPVLFGAFRDFEIADG